jgi:hypothetical protein
MKPELPKHELDLGSSNQQEQLRGKSLSPIHQCLFNRLPLVIMSTVRATL